MEFAFVKAEVKSLHMILAGIPESLEESPEINLQMHFTEIVRKLMGMFW
jgi:hypothetical protein